MHWQQLADKVIKVNSSSLTKEQFKIALKYENIAIKYLNRELRKGNYSNSDMRQYYDYLRGKIKYTNKGTSHEEVNN